ncbi:Hypothetical predicted protein [Xyrichtys novacula]|uniref:Uncharacterized protein n=1 Tax=Xyrichtys novacula TaxID=13765 RepID=A0AAV1FCM4_XYRNO|nr:Hypothetical predicted protein [Xyrichtys novacula]
MCNTASAQVKERNVSKKVRASGLHDPPHCGQAHVTICHVSPHSCRGTRCSKKRLQNLSTEAGSQADFLSAAPAIEEKSEFPGVMWSLAASEATCSAPARRGFLGNGVIHVTESA